MPARDVCNGSYRNAVANLFQAIDIAVRQPLGGEVVEEGRLPRRCPRPLAHGDKQKAALIQEDEMSAKSSGYFLSPAMCSASNWPSPAYPAGGGATPAPDNSGSGVVRSSRHATVILSFTKAG
jgi:hypothetical protein